MPSMRMPTSTRMLTPGTIMPMAKRTITVTTMVMVTITITIMRMTTTTIIMMSIATMPIITTTTPMLMTANEPDPAAVRGGMAEDEAAALYRLMTWLSPSFPVGAFAYSSGIEWAVEAGDITDAASLRGWLAAMLTDGSGFCDAVFLAQSHRAASEPGHA